MISRPNDETNKQPGISKSSSFHLGDRRQTKKQDPKTKAVEVSPAILAALKTLHQKVKTTKEAKNEAKTTTAGDTDEAMSY